MPRIKTTRRKTKKCNKYLYKIRGGEGEVEGEAQGEAQGQGVPPENTTSEYGYGENMEEESAPQESWSSPMSQPQEPSSESSYMSTNFSPMGEKPTTPSTMGTMGMDESSGTAQMDKLQSVVDNVRKNTNKMSERIAGLTGKIKDIYNKLKNWSMGHPKTEQLQSGGTRKRRHSTRRHYKKRKHSKKTRKN